MNFAVIASESYIDKMRILLIFLLAACSIHAEVERFDGYSVYRVFPTNEDQKEFLLKLENSLDLDFWAEVNNVGLPVDVMVKPADQRFFLNDMRQAGMEPEILINDVQSLIETQSVAKFVPGGRMTWTQYHTLEGIYSWLDDVIASNPDTVTGLNIGNSFEGRPIRGVKISFGAGKRVSFIEGGIHAREWVSPPTVTYLINELLTSTDPRFRRIAESQDWYIFPVTNPDGYVFTHTNNRMWRKTRRPYGTCVGADPNRNWDASWMEQGASSNPCSDLYAGPEAFSEIEVSTLADFIRSVASEMDVYISFHSFSQLLLLPYGHTTQPLDNYNEMMQIGAKTAEALAQKYGTVYRVGNIAEIIYLASGGSIDWVKQEFKTPVVVAYELRDTGTFGFLLPPSQILPNCEEVIDSLIGMYEEAANFDYVNLD